MPSKFILTYCLKGSLRTKVETMLDQNAMRLVFWVQFCIENVRISSLFRKHDLIFCFAKPLATKLSIFVVQNALLYLADDDNIIQVRLCYKHLWFSLQFYKPCNIRSLQYCRPKSTCISQQMTMKSLSGDQVRCRVLLLML